jgi:hypothetical protein
MAVFGVPTIRTSSLGSAPFGLKGYAALTQFAVDENPLARAHFIELGWDAVVPREIRRWLALPRLRVKTPSC